MSLQQNWSVKWMYIQTLMLGVIVHPKMSYFMSVHVKQTTITLLIVYLEMSYYMSVHVKKTMTTLLRNVNSSANV